MTSEATRALLDRLLGLWSNPIDDAEIALSAFGEVYTDPISINDTVLPLSALVERGKSRAEAFEAHETTILETLELPGKIVIAFIARMKHIGTLHTTIGDLPASGRTAEARTIDILTVTDGRISEIRVVSDDLGVLKQLGGTLSPAEDS